MEDRRERCNIACSSQPSQSSDAAVARRFQSCEFERNLCKFAVGGIMKVLLVVASALLLCTIMLSIPVDALQGKHLDTAITNVATPN